MKTDIFTNVAKSATRTFHKVGFKVKKHSPEILMATGVVGVVTSAVMACKATTKVNDILEDTKTQVESVHNVLADDSISEEKYSVEDSKKDLAIIYVQTAVKFVKLYAPSVILGGLSITAILASNNILRKRNVALAAAYASVDKGFKEYRSRVVERFGKELDHELRYNVKAKEIEETTVDENGEVHTEKKTVNTVDKSFGASEYAKFFDEYCTGWTKDPDFNLMFLRRQQDYANELLKSRGYVFLNEVYDMIGVPRTKAGQIVGWVYDEKNADGDGYIDFGIYDTYRMNEGNAERKRAFVNGYERSILLDFNVDGPILDKM